MNQEESGPASARIMSTSQERQIVTFRLNGTEYGLAASDVLGIYHGLPLIPTPDENESAPSVGDVNVSGKRVSVLSLRSLLNLPETQKKGDWILLAEKKDKQVGLLIDEVVESVRFIMNRAHSTPHGSMVVHGGRTIQLLNLEKLFAEQPA